MASNDTAIAAVMEQLMAEGPQAMAQVMTMLMNAAMRLEREQFLGAGHYERSAGRRGFANGTKLKKIDTPAGTLTLDVPKTAGASAPFFRTPLAWAAQKKNSSASRQNTARQPLNSPPGSKTTPPKAWPFSSCQASAAGPCAPRTPSSARSSRRSNEGPGKYASSQTRPRSSASSLPSWSKSTSNGPLRRNPMSTSTTPAPNDVHR